MKYGWLTFIALCLGMIIQPVHAHSRGSSYSIWNLQPGEPEVTARVSQLQLSRLQLHPGFTQNYAHEVGALLARDLQLWAGTVQCKSVDVRVTLQSEGWVAAHWKLDCPSSSFEAGDWSIRTRLFETVAPSHLHFVRVNMANGENLQRVLSFADPRLQLSLSPVMSNTPDTLGHFVLLGLEHILSGWDHLAFLLMLILLAQRLREVILIATGFTISHSLTLAAAALGWIHVDQPRIEAVIGFSIALVAVENLWLRSQRDAWIPRIFLIVLVCMTALAIDQRLLMAGLLLISFCYFGLVARSNAPGRLRLILTLLFGLVHGFGFAGLMGELQLPTASLTLGLLGFNLGVELGQFAVIALVWPALWALRRWPVWAQWSHHGLSSAVAGLGMFWFVTRTLI